MSGFRKLMIRVLKSQALKGVGRLGMMLREEVCLRLVKEARYEEVKYMVDRGMWVLRPVQEC